MVQKKVEVDSSAIIDSNATFSLKCLVCHSFNFYSNSELGGSLRLVGESKLIKNHFFMAYLVSTKRANVLTKYMVEK